MKIYMLVHTCTQHRNLRKAGARDHRTEKCIGLASSQVLQMATAWWPTAPFPTPAVLLLLYTSFTLSQCFLLPSCFHFALYTYCSRINFIVPHLQCLRILRHCSVFLHYRANSQRHGYLLSSSTAYIKPVKKISHREGSLAVKTQELIHTRNTPFNSDLHWGAHVRNYERNVC